VMLERILHNWRAATRTAEAAPAGRNLDTVSDDEMFGIIDEVLGGA
jgi:hypothetical protein